MMKPAYSGFGETATRQMGNMPIAPSASVSGLSGGTRALNAASPGPASILWVSPAPDCRAHLSQVLYVLAPVVLRHIPYG